MFGCDAVRTASDPARCPSKKTMLAQEREETIQEIRSIQSDSPPERAAVSAFFPQRVLDRRLRYARTPAINPPLKRISDAGSGTCAGRGRSSPITTSCSMFEEGPSNEMSGGGAFVPGSSFPDSGGVQSSADLREELPCVDPALP